jgi:hypothetical protein
MNEWSSGEDEVSGIGDAHGGMEGVSGAVFSVLATEKGGSAISLVLLKRVASLKEMLEWREEKMAKGAVGEDQQRLSGGDDVVDENP